MAEKKHDYIENIEDVITETNMQTVEISIIIPGLMTRLMMKRHFPFFGTYLKDNCTVQPTFNENSLEVISIVKKDDTEDKYRYILQKLPGEIIPEECSTKYKDGLITLILKKAKPAASWEVPITKGLHKMKK